MSISEVCVLFLLFAITIVGWDVSRAIRSIGKGLSAQAGAAEARLRWNKRLLMEAKEKREVAELKERVRACRDYLLDLVEKEWSGGMSPWRVSVSATGDTPFVDEAHFGPDNPDPEVELRFEHEDGVNEVLVRIWPDQDPNTMEEGMCIMGCEGLKVLGLHKDKEHRDGLVCDKAFPLDDRIVNKISMLISGMRYAHPCESRTKEEESVAEPNQPSESVAPSEPVVPSANS